jgi:hypothetical protein
MWTKGRACQLSGASAVAAPRWPTRRRRRRRRRPATASSAVHRPSVVADGVRRTRRRTRTRARAWRCGLHQLQAHLPPRAPAAAPAPPAAAAPAAAAPRRAARPIDAPCARCLRHGDPIHARKGLTSHSHVCATSSALPRQRLASAEAARTWLKAALSSASCSGVRCGGGGGGGRQQQQAAVSHVGHPAQLTTRPAQLRRRRRRRRRRLTHRRG